MAVVPCPIFTLPVLESVKVGAFTPKVRVIVGCRLPDVPVMVNGYWPTATELLAVSVSSVVPLVGFGFQSAVTPLGKPDTPNVTLPENPYSGST